jgi:hypothetical protein
MAPEILETGADRIVAGQGSTSSQLYETKLIYRSEIRRYHTFSPFFFFSPGIKASSTNSYWLNHAINWPDTIQYKIFDFISSAESAVRLPPLNCRFP